MLRTKQNSYEIAVSCFFCVKFSEKPVLNCGWVAISLLRILNFMLYLRNKFPEHKIYLRR